MNCDILVIGAGHAGCEAAHAAAAMRMRTVLLTMPEGRIAEMSCNPAVGGLAKGHIVKEIDALGGIMGIITDKAGIQFRVLNRSRGPAVRAPRVQCDRDIYSEEMNKFLLNVDNLRIIEGEAVALIVNENRIKGVRLADGNEISCLKAVLTAGTFLRGLIHIGPVKKNAGRFGEPPASMLSSSLAENGIELARLKTGTPARVLKNSVHWDAFTEQKGETPPVPVSWRTSGITNPQISCFTGYTNPEVHNVILRNMDKSPLYSGEIVGVGPRYCPSIEDKVVRFREKDRHQIFLEPEGLKSDWIYLNGISSSLPSEVQDEFLRKVEGLEDIEVARYGYAIEYDFIPPTQLKLSLETKALEGLYPAGQVNGTSGYEEAAAQGMIAGINASLAIQGNPPLTVERSSGYIGVLIDDLVTKGTKEPYRMFTSRAEYRLLLGTDSADRRFTDKGFELGLISRERKDEVDAKYQRIEKARIFLGSQIVNPTKKNAARIKERLNTEISRPSSLDTLLKRPEIDIFSLKDFIEGSGFPELSHDDLEILENLVKYEGYITKQRQDIERQMKQEMMKIPADFVYKGIPGLSNEVVQKLEQVRPENLGQAGRISGVTPGAVTLIAIYIKKRTRPGD